MGGLPILKKSDKQTHLELFGYTTMPILSQAETSNLINSYKEKLPVPKKGFHASMYNPNESYKIWVDNLISPFLKDKLAATIENYSILYSNFMVKEPGIESEMYLHQDWAYVDESRNSSYAIWIPLVDTTVENGCIHVVPKSHLLKNEIRGYGTFDPLDKIRNGIKAKHLQKIELKAGEAIIWDHRLIHWSPPNKSNQRRIAITSILCPDNVPGLHYFSDRSENLSVLKYDTNKSFFLNYELGNKPHGPSTEITLPSNFKYLDDSSFEQTISLKNKPKRKSLLSFFKRA